MKESRYTCEQVAKGNQFYTAIESVPQDQRPIVRLMVESFINGMNAAEELRQAQESA